MFDLINDLVQKLLWDKGFTKAIFVPANPPSSPSAPPSPLGYTEAIFVLAILPSPLPPPPPPPPGTMVRFCGHADLTCLLAHENFREGRKYFLAPQIWSGSSALSEHFVRDGRISSIRLGKKCSIAHLCIHVEQWSVKCHPLGW